LRRFHPIIAIITGILFIFILNQIINYIFDSLPINGMLSSELITILVLVLLILGGFITAFITNKNRLLSAFCVGLFIAIIYNVISTINNAIYISYFNPISAIVFFVLIALIAALITTLGGFIAVRLITKYVNIWNEKGVALDELGNHEDAIKAYDRALKLDANDVDALFNKGETLGILGKHEEAIKYFNIVLKIDPDDAETWYEKGVNLKKLGKHEEAIKYFDKALQLDPDDTDALQGKEEILSMIQSKNT
jgi:tetratricopeptide (TPR) repeat protein